MSDWTERLKQELKPMTERTNRIRAPAYIKGGLSYYGNSFDIYERVSGHFFRQRREMSSAVPVRCEQERPDEIKRLRKFVLAGQRKESRGTCDAYVEVFLNKIGQPIRKAIDSHKEDRFEL